MMFAMARRGDLPTVLEHTTETFKVPDVGILATGFIIVALSIFGTIEWVVSAAAFTILVYYGIANLAALKMKREDKLFPKFIAVIGVIACGALALSLRLSAIIAGVVLLTAGLAFRSVFRKVTGAS